MTTPSSLKISVPPKFSNSFWSCPDYRKGVEALYSRLQSGLDENESILALVQHRAALEYSHAEQLATPCPLPSFSSPMFKGALREGGSKTARSFTGNDSSASHAFRTIEAESVRHQAGAHAKVARNLENHILIPFGKWIEEHKEKIHNSWEFVDANLQRYERQRADMEKTRAHYESKCRNADEAEDDARFAGGEIASPPFISSDSNTLEEKERITRNVSEKQAMAVSLPEKKVEETSPPSAEEADLDLDRLKRRETIREQFGFRRASGGREGIEKALPKGPRSVSAETPTSQKTYEAEHKEDGEGAGTSLKRSTTLSSALSSAISKASEVPALQNLRAVVGVLNEPKHLRLRKEAEAAEMQYREAVRALDKLRCELEEILHDHFTLTERWEGSRLVAVRRVMGTLNGSFAPLLPLVSASLQRCSALEASVDPALSLSHLILDARTGLYQPQPQVFHPYYHDDASSLSGAGTAGFGMDLTAFMRAETLVSEEAGGSGEIRAGAGESHRIGMPAIPLALMAVLAALERLYDDEKRWPVVRLEDKEGEVSASALMNAEKRKAWIYEVPLVNAHVCRETIISHLLGNSVPGANVGAGLEAKLLRFDAPTLAATVKLWTMELADSLIPSDQWDSVVSTYRAAASQEYDARLTPSKTVADASAEGEAVDVKGKGRAEGTTDPVLEETIRKGVLADLGVILSRLPKIHLVCLDALVGHLSRLIKSSPSTEADSVYITKLALSLDRVLLRPPTETTSSLRSRTSSLLACDLIKYYDDLLPTLLEKKAKESEAVQSAQRRTPIRKRTKPVDQRMSRSKIAAAHRSEPVPPIAYHGRVASEDIKKSEPGPQPPPRLETTLPAMEDGTESSTPTPIASRILGGVKESAATKTEKTLATDEAGPARIKSPSSVSATSSSYDTPPDETDDSTAQATMAASSNSATASNAETPLSNVARLSRQFGSSGSVKSMVRGPRAANASGAASSSGKSST